MKIAIYIPGLELEAKEPNLEKYALRLKKALDLNDPIVENQYELKMSKENYGTDGKKEVDVATIFITDKVVTSEFYKIYKYDYAPQLTKDFDRKSIFFKCLTLIVTIFSGTFRFIKPIFKPKKKSTLSRHYQLQTLYFLTILLLISLLVIILLPSALASIISLQPQLVQTLKPLGIETLILRLHNWGISGKQLKNISSVLVAISTLVFLLRPGLRSSLNTLAVEYLCLDYYLRFAQSKPQITGGFDTLLEYIAGKNGSSQTVELHAYSFGSIVAYDCIFPYNSPLLTRKNSYISRLITIGSPHDFIRNYYPLYFTSRTRQPHALTQWFNVYSRADILSSNFRYDGLDGEAEFAVVEGGLIPKNIEFEFIQPKALSWWDTFRLYTLKIHSGYWDTDEDATSCMSNIVEALARG